MKYDTIERYWEIYFQLSRVAPATNPLITS